MYYYLFINNYENKISNIILLDKEFNNLQTKNIIFFLFNSTNFKNLKENNKLKIVMSFKELENYHSFLLDDKYIIPFLQDENSLKFITKSLFTTKLENKQYINNYNVLLNFLKYMNDKKYNKVVLISSVVYLLYGLRVNKDIDLLTAENYKINFPGKIKIDPYYVKNNNSPYTVLFDDPEYTFYFKGLRIITLKTDISYIRNIRLTFKRKNNTLEHPKALADILMVKKLIEPEINIPVDITKINEVNKNKVLKTIKHRYRSKYNPFMDKTLIQ